MTSEFLHFMVVFLCSVYSTAKLSRLSLVIVVHMPRKVLILARLCRAVDLVFDYARCFARRREMMR